MKRKVFKKHLKHLLYGVIAAGAMFVGVTAVSQTQASADNIIKDVPIVQDSSNYLPTWITTLHNVPNQNTEDYIRQHLPQGFELTEDKMQTTPNIYEGLRTYNTDDHNSFGVPSYLNPYEEEVVPTVKITHKMVFGNRIKYHGKKFSRRHHRKYHSRKYVKRFNVRQAHKTRTYFGIPYTAYNGY